MSYRCDKMPIFSWSYKNWIKCCFTVDKVNQFRVIFMWNIKFIVYKPLKVICCLRYLHNMEIFIFHQILEAADKIQAVDMKKHALRLIVHHFPKVGQHHCMNPGLHTENINARLNQMLWGKVSLHTYLFIRANRNLTLPFLSSWEKKHNFFFSTWQKRLNYGPNTPDFAIIITWSIYRSFSFEGKVHV